MKTKKKIDKIVLLEKNKIKSNKSFFRICVVIKNNLGGGIYVIKINGNYDFAKLYHDELYCVNFSSLQKCEIHFWEDINIYNKTHIPIIKNNEEIIDSSESEDDLNEEIFGDKENALTICKTYKKSESL